MSNDSLQYIPMERWEELEIVFEADWPLSISALTALKTQRQIGTLGLGYGFKVYCPYGLPANGMVALNKKDNFNEVIIYCGINNISNLENALSSTKLVDWKSPLTIPFLPEHIFKSIEKVAPKVNVEVENHEDHSLHQVVLLDKKTPLFEDITIPEHITFKLLTEEYIDAVDSVWPNRYDGSKWLFQLLIKAKFGYGLFRNDTLLSWVFINEVGSITHMFTFENYRNRGYGKTLLKLVCNQQLKQMKHTFGYCKVGNTFAFRLYKSLGFQLLHNIQWCCTNPK